MPRNPFQRPPVVNRKNSNQPNTSYGGDPWQKPKRGKKKPAVTKEETVPGATPNSPDDPPPAKPD